METFSTADRQFMARAIQLAKHGQYTTHPNPNVGCVLVRDGEILAEGWTQPPGQAHAEVHALQQLAHRADGATAYVTLEPCSHYGRTPPCADALIKAGVKRVVVAMVDPNPLVSGQGLEKLQQAGVATAHGLLEQQARSLIPGFISAMTRQRPYVRVKMAMSLDGRTAMSSGESVWITGEAARRDVQFWRARAGAVLTGINTVVMDRPSLNVRLGADELGVVAEVRQPDRVILDSRLRLPIDAPLLDLPGRVRVYSCVDVVSEQEKIDRLQAKGVKLRLFEGERLALPDVLTALHEDGINEVHVEAGATLGGQLIEQGLADELLIYMAPHLMGADARALFNIPLQQMSERISLAVQDIRAIGDDWRILATLRSN